MKPINIIYIVKVLDLKANTFAAYHVRYCESDAEDELEKMIKKYKSVKNDRYLLSYEITKSY